MRVLFLDGWQSLPGGAKPTYLKDHGHEVINPKLPDEDFAEAIRIAQAEFDGRQPQVVVGSSRGGAVAMNINSGEAKLVLLCPAWKKWGTARTVRHCTVILHSRADDVAPFADSEELARTSGATLIEVGIDHRLADPEPLAAMLKACNDATPMLKTGDVVRGVVRKTAVFGLFCEVGTHEILVLIPEISWIPSFASCEQVAAAGDELEVKIVHIDRQRNKVAGSVRALHPESDPGTGRGNSASATCWKRPSFVGLRRPTAAAVREGTCSPSDRRRWSCSAARRPGGLRAATGLPSGCPPSTHGKARWRWRWCRDERAW